MNITFRKITVNDLEVFIKMRINQLREEGAKEDINLEAALKDYYLRHLSDGTFISWLALDNDRIIGTSGMSIVEKPPYFGCPSGKIAKTLLSKVIDEAKTQGCGTVQITASDMGVLLYSDYGFEKNENFMQFKL